MPARQPLGDSTIQRLFIMPTLGAADPVERLSVVLQSFPQLHPLFAQREAATPGGLGRANFDVLLSYRRLGRAFAVTGSLCAAVGPVSGVDRLRPGPAIASQIQSQRAADHVDPHPHDAFAGHRRDVLAADLQPADGHFQLPDRVLESIHCAHLAEGLTR